MVDNLKCEYCGSVVARGDAKCNTCGAPLTEVSIDKPREPVLASERQPREQHQDQVNAGLKTSGMATASMWIGISSIVVCCFGGPIGALGLILGSIALSETKKGGYTPSAVVSAKRGISFSLIGITLFIILIVISSVSEPS